MSSQIPRGTVHITMEHVGGVDEADLRFDEGTTILTGENASNRTSFLSGVAGAVGAEVPTLKRGEENGRVEMRIDDETYWVQLEDDGENTNTRRETYADAEDRDLCRLYVSLLEDNPIRRAIRNGGNLYSLLMEPVDIEENQRKIQRKMNRKRELRSTVDELQATEDSIEELRETRDTYEDTLESLREDLDTIQTELSEMLEEVSQTEGLDELTEELQQRQEQLEKKHRQIERAKGKIDQHKDDIQEKREELEQLREREFDIDPAEVERQIDRHRSERRRFKSQNETILRLITQNEEALDGNLGDILASGSEDVTAELHPESQEIQCWACGSEIEQSAIRKRTDELRDIVDSNREQISKLEAEIDRLEERQAEYDETQDTVDRLKTEIEELEEKKKERAELVSQHEADLPELEEAIAEIQREIEETQTEHHDQIEAYNQEASKLRSEIDDVERDLEKVTDDIEQKEAEVARIPDLADEKEQLAEELQELRAYVKSVEEETVETVNQMMAAVLEELGYDNIDSIWIERKANEESGQERDVTFELHIVRPGGQSDTIANLSTSEREVVGLIVAVSGHLVHDVDERVPFILLDDVEALDAERLRNLYEFLNDQTKYLLGTAHPEDEPSLQDAEFDCVQIGDVVS